MLLPVEGSGLLKRQRLPKTPLALYCPEKPLVVSMLLKKIWRRGGDSVVLRILKTSVLFNLRIVQIVEKWQFEGVQTRFKHVSSSFNSDFASASAAGVSAAGPSWFS
jgi:hypothetical protein